jgi:hypothetical protein
MMLPLRGCNITAVLGVGYVIGDADLTREQYEVAVPEVIKISHRFGKRDHLLKEITDYLISIGRVFPPPKFLREYPLPAGKKH